MSVQSHLFSNLSSLTDENEIINMALSAMEGSASPDGGAGGGGGGRRTPMRSQSHHSLYLLNSSPSSRSNISHFSPISHISAGSPTGLDLHPEVCICIYAYIYRFFLSQPWIDIDPSIYLHYPYTESSPPRSSDKGGSR